MKRGQVCPACHGSGHTANDRPKVELRKHMVDGKPRLKHITQSQGSGCLRCTGLGVIPEGQKHDYRQPCEKYSVSMAGEMYCPTETE